MNCKIKPTVNLEGCQKIDLGLRHCSGIRVEVPTNTESHLNQDSDCVNRNVITLSTYVQAVCEKDLILHSSNICHQLSTDVESDMGVPLSVRFGPLAG
jgi:hypothetical protein